MNEDDKPVGCDRCGASLEPGPEQRMAIKNLQESGEALCVKCGLEK